MQGTPLWKPLPGPQTEAFRCRADELFYGGAAGGGKTDLLLGLAVTAHQRSIIFRREFAQLQGIIERSRVIIGDGGQFNGQSHIWRLGDGRLIELGAVQREEHVQKYQGRGHDLVCFDEVAHFSEAQYRFLNGWKRTERRGQRTRTVVTGNPPATSEGQWVIGYWGPWLNERHPHPARPGELRWYAMLDGQDVEVEGPAPIQHKGERILARSRTFIPARIEDNPYYMATGYQGQLQALPEPLRSQLLYGDFHVTVDDDPWQIIPTAWVKAAIERGRARSQPETPLTALGVDVARGGKDKTVLAPRYGNWIAPLRKFPGASTPNGPLVAAQVIDILGESGAVANVDVIGVGSSVYDCLQGKVPVCGVNFAAGTKATDRSGRLGFANVRAEAYWRLREALDPAQGDDLALPDDPELLADLCAPRWSMRVSGIQVESKEDIIARLGRSPDAGDAVTLALYASATLGANELLDIVQAWR